MQAELWNDVLGAFHPASAPDYLPVAQLQQVQLQRLQSVVKRAYEHVPLFRQRLEERSLKPEDIRSLEDIRRLPFTVKNDLRDTYPFGLFASPMQEIVRLHASSGTTGKPIVVAYTQADLEVWTSVMVRSFAACGMHQGDIVQNAYGYGLFTGGLGMHYGAEALGATVIPISGGNTDRQIMLMKDFGATAICCTPSYFIHLIERAGEMGVNLKELPLRIGVFGRSPGRNPCAGISGKTPISSRMIFTASPRSPVRVWRWSAAAMLDCTSSRIISIPRSLTRRPGRCFPTKPRANWC